MEWISIFDFGLGHGFRNKFAVAIAEDKLALAKKYVSTAYISMAVIMLAVMFLLIPSVALLNWGEILNTASVSGIELKFTILLVLVVFAIRFTLQLVTVMLKALQQPALSDSFLPIAGLISLLLIPIMRHFVTDSLFWACAIIAIPPVMVLLIANAYIYFKRYPQYCPSRKSYDRSLLSDIYSLGAKFFIGQVAALVMFGTSNVILARAVNPAEVTLYNIANKYFSLPLSYFMIIVTPYWSAVTDAYTKSEFTWIRQNMKKLNYTSAFFCVGLFIMFLLSKVAFSLWVGDTVRIPWRVSLSMFFYNSSLVFLSPYTMFINGFGKLKLGTYGAVVKTLMFIPIAWYLALSFGALGLVVALILVNSLPNALLSIIQYNKIVHNKDHDIWAA